MTNLLVEQMLDLIKREYPHVVTLRTMSTTIGRQPAYLGRLFHQEVGASAHEHLTRVRLEHAVELIREGVKIEAVALSVGYRSKKNFYKQFRKRYGTTPIPYRCCPAGAETARGRTKAFRFGGPQPLATAGNTPRPRRFRNEQGAGTDPAPTERSVAAIVRASTRAWRLAVRTQRLMLQRFNRLRIGVLLTDEAGLYVGANRAAIAATGYSSAELCGLSPAELFVDGPPAATRCVWQLLLFGRRRHGRSSNATLRTRSGDPVTAHVVTLHNFLWGRREMFDMLNVPPVSAG